MNGTRTLRGARAHSLLAALVRWFAVLTERGYARLVPAPSVRDHVRSLRGQTLRTITENEPNRVVDVTDREVIIGTQKSPEGKPVDLDIVQEQADLIWDGLAVEINPESMGYRRSSAVGAILRTMPGVEVLLDGERQRLRLSSVVLHGENPSPADKADRIVRAALRATGGVASREEVVAWATEHGGYPQSDLIVDGAGRTRVELWITMALRRAVASDDLARIGGGRYAIRPREASAPAEPSPVPEEAPAPVVVADLIEGTAATTNPAWVFDELILALDLYLRWRPKQPPAGHADLVTLSDTLKRLPVHPPETRADDFRNANSVRRKLGDYTAPDPDQTGQPTKGGEGVHLVWAEFAEDPEALAAAVERITASVDAPPLPPPDEDEAEAVEGRILLREHRARERNAALVRARKAAAMKATGRLACEVCGLDFGERYGDLGEGFMEAHHTVPLALGSVRVTRADDLALLCANCHRMIHRARPMLTVDELRDRLSD